MEGFAAYELKEDERGNDLQAISKWIVLMPKDYHIYPGELNDIGWCSLMQEQLYLRKTENERFKNNLKGFFKDLASKIYGTN